MLFRGKALLLSMILHVFSNLPTYADQWGSVVLTHCYDLKGREYYKKHFFIRVFWTELGGGQFHRNSDSLDGPMKLQLFHKKPATCMIQGKKVVFETQDYRKRTDTGACGRCERTGFRLTVDEKLIWEKPAPKRLGEPIFNGEIDIDRDSIRVCEDRRPEEIGVDISGLEGVVKHMTRVRTCREIY